MPENNNALPGNAAIINNNQYNQANSENTQANNKIIANDHGDNNIQPGHPFIAPQDINFIHQIINILPENNQVIQYPFIQDFQNNEIIEIQANHQVIALAPNDAAPQPDPDNQSDH